MNVQDEFTFFAPKLLKDELKQSAFKIQAYSKLNQTDLADIEALIFININFVSEEQISEKVWIKAFALM